MKMSYPVIFDFDKLKPCTMTVIVKYDVKDINLNALFILLPVTKEKVNDGDSGDFLGKKGGKIIFPQYMNKPGEILSMRWNHQVRGIMRSSKINKFPNSIVMDIGTSGRVISAKLSKTIELCGPTSEESIKEVLKYLLGHIQETGKDIEFLKENRAEALFLKEEYLKGRRALDDGPQSKILKIMEKYSQGYDALSLPSFLNFLLSLDFLYTGTLKVEEYFYEMTNILFNFGFPINQMEMARIMNSYPFVCNHTNMKSSNSVRIRYLYYKMNRNTGSQKLAIHTIKVNKSGHIKYSGPSLSQMRPIYYLFIERVLANYESICLYEPYKYSLPKFSSPRVYTREEWLAILREEDELRKRILDGEFTSQALEEYSS